MKTIELNEQELEFLKQLLDSEMGPHTSGYWRMQCQELINKLNK